MRKSLFVDTLHSFGTSVALIPLGMVSSVLLARLLGPDGKGGYDLFANSTALLVMVVGFSLPTGITYVTARSNTALLSTVGWVVVATLGQTMAAAACLGLLQQSDLASVFLPRANDREMVLFATAYVALVLLAGYWRAILVGRQEIVGANRVTLFTRCLDVSLLIALLVVLRYTNSSFDLGLALGLLMISMLGTNLLFLLALRRLAWSRQGSADFKQVLRFAAPSYGGNLVQFLNYRMDMFLVSAFIGQRGVGLYALAVSLAQMLLLLSGAVGTALLPRVANQRDQAAQAVQSARATRLSLWASLLGGAVFALVTLVALPVVYGEPFRASIAPFLWLMPGIILIGPASILATHIAGMGAPHINLYIAIVALGATVLLDFALIPRIGISGAAIASTVSYSISSISTVLVFTRKLHVSLSDILWITPADVSLLGSRWRSFRAGRVSDVQ